MYLGTESETLSGTQRCQSVIDGDCSTVQVHYVAECCFQLLHLQLNDALQTAAAHKHTASIN